jgi:hypothetical protein
MATTTTKKRTSTKATSKSSPPQKLQPNAFLFEILELVSKQRTKSSKINILKEYDDPSLRTIFIWNFDESVISLLPEGHVPHSNLKDQTSLGGTLTDKVNSKISGSDERVTFNGLSESASAGHTSLRREHSKLYNFVKGGNDGLKSMRRETMFIQILEGLHPLEAELLILVKDKKLSTKYKITKEIVAEAYPDIIWGGRS